MPNPLFHMSPDDFKRILKDTKDRMIDVWNGSSHTKRSKIFLQMMEEMELEQLGQLINMFR